MMDIFGRKRIHDLEYELAIERGKRLRAEGDLRSLEKKFDAMSELEESIPEDCTKGPWCKACEFVAGFGHHYTTTAYVCGKGKSCNNFVQKKMEDYS